MKYISIKEAAVHWGVSEQLVRRYCRDGRIPGASQKDGAWSIPSGAKKPGMQITNAPKDPTAFAKRIMYQKQKNNHFGIYEYIQVNLAYSSSRMASNRLTRTQVLEAYRTNKISTAFEPIKIDDLTEIVNHFLCVRYVVDNLMSPLHLPLIKKLHYMLFYGTYSDRKDKNRLGIVRESAVQPLTELLTAYERERQVDFHKILDFHVKFERIRPFDDGNGRVGRVLMMKECLRHGIDPFIIDDKRRGQYNKGISGWDTNSEILRTVCQEAQARFHGQMELCRLMQYCRTPGK